MRKNRAFTLVELLVVISIIALLLSVLMPALQRTRKQAMAAACLAKMHQWGVVFSIYTSDNDNYWHSRVIGEPEGWTKLWQFAMRPKYEEVELLNCPTAMNQDRQGGTYGVWWAPGGQADIAVDGWLGSYSLNRYVPNITGDYSDEPEEYARYWRHTQVKGGDKVPVLVDGQYSNFWPNNDRDPPEFEPPPYGSVVACEQMEGICLDRHLGHINGVFMDFSCRKIGIKELWTLKWNRTIDTCTEWSVCGHGGDDDSCRELWNDTAPWLKKYPVY